MRRSRVRARGERVELPQRRRRRRQAGHAEKGHTIIVSGQIGDAPGRHRPPRPAPPSPAPTLMRLRRAPTICRMRSSVPVGCGTFVIRARSAVPTVRRLSLQCVICAAAGAPDLAGAFFGAALWAFTCFSPSPVCRQHGQVQGLLQKRVAGPSLPNTRGSLPCRHSASIQSGHSMLKHCGPQHIASRCPERRRSSPFRPLQRQSPVFARRLTVGFALCLGILVGPNATLGPSRRHQWHMRSHWPSICFASTTTSVIPHPSRPFLTPGAPLRRQLSPNVHPLCPTPCT